MFAAIVLVLVLMIVVLSGLGGKDRTYDERPHLPADDFPDNESVDESD